MFLIQNDENHEIHVRVFFEIFFFLILRFTHWSQKLGYKNMTMEIHGFFKSSTELVDGSSTRELFSFHAFEQMENLFTDKRRRYRANEQQAARPRFALSQLAASCKLMLLVWRGWATTQPSSNEKQLVHTESSTWMNTKIQNTKDFKTTWQNIPTNINHK